MRRVIAARSATSLVLFAFVTASLAACAERGDQSADSAALSPGEQAEARLEGLEARLSENPRDPQLLYAYGVANLQAGRPSLALWPLREAREHTEWALRAGLALAQAALAAGDAGTAVEAASRVIDVEPDLREALALRAEAHARASHFEPALEDAARLLEDDPDSFEVQLLRLRSLIGLTRLEEADALFEELEGKWRDGGVPEPVAERYCAARVSFTRESGRTELAETRVLECLEEFPLGASVLKQAVAHFDGTQQPERATAVLREALRASPGEPALRETLAARLRASGQTDEAEALLREGTRLEPAVALQAWGGLASHAFQLGDFDAAATAWEKVLEHVDEPDFVFGYGEALVHAGRPEQALEVAARLPEVYGELLRGLARLEQDRPGEALRHFEAGLRLWPNQSIARRHAAVAAERTGDFDRAISEYRQSLRSGGTSDAGVRLARLHLAEGAYEPAWQAIALHLESKPHDPEAQLVGLRIAARRGRGDLFERALASLRGPRQGAAAWVAEVVEIVAEVQGPEAALDLIARAPGIDLAEAGNADALRAQVLQLCAAGRGEEALERARRTSTAQPEVADFHEIRGRALECSGAGPAAARAAYAAALESEPDHGRAHAALGRLATERGEPSAARDHFARAAAADPADVGSRRRAAELALTLGDREDARRRLESLLRDHPYDGLAAARLAVALRASERDAERALALAERALRFRGGPEAYGIWVDLHTQRARPAEAAPALEALADRRPRDPSLHYHLGRALAAAGRTEEARDALSSALALEAFAERPGAEAMLASLVDASRSGRGGAQEQSR